MGEYYVFKTKSHYAPTFCDMTAVISTVFGKENGYPKYAYRLLLYFIAKVENINRQKEDKSSGCKPFEASVRELAKAFEIEKTSIQRAIKWLVEKDWLDARRVKGKQETFYLPNVDKINKEIDEYSERHLKEEKKKRGKEDTEKQSKQLVESDYDWEELIKNCTH